jgi:ferredoxin-nitrite reductase
LLRAYLARRASPDETFAAFARRHTVDALQTLANEEATP